MAAARHCWAPALRPNREDGKLVLPPHSTLVLYTDGLIERRAERPLDEGLSMLAASVRADAADPEKTCEAILDELIGDAPRMDDVALLVMCTA